MVRTSKVCARTSKAVPSRWKAKRAASRVKAPARAACGAPAGMADGKRWVRRETVAARENAQYMPTC
jgi:hypothetical protein